jgi:hypothetical protein
MILLQTALEELGVKSVQFISQHQEQFEQFCQSHSPLYERVLQAKPSVNAQQHLLGVMTKAHLELFGSLTAHQDAIEQMRQAFVNELGQEQANILKLPAGIEMQLATHLWLFVQGRLGMDFSLANDHSQQSANLLSQLLSADSDALRCQFNHSFYVGYRHFEAKKTTPSLWKRWFEKWFN